MKSEEPFLWNFGQRISLTAMYVPTQVYDKKLFTAEIFSASLFHGNQIKRKTRYKIITSTNEL